MMKLGIFSFFTGAGFLDLGFESEGYESLYANEISPEFCKAYRYSREKMGIHEPKYGLREISIERIIDSENEANYITKSLIDSYKKYDFVGFIGGPPCPDFSVGGKNKGKNGENGRLSQSYVDTICHYKPDFFVFENVKGLWKTKKHREFFDALCHQLQNSEYSLDSKLLNAIEFGVAQDRERVFLIGIKNSLLGKHSQNGRIVGFQWSNFAKYSSSIKKSVDWPKTSKFVEDSVLPKPIDIPEDLTVEHWFQKNDVTNHANSNDYFIPRAGLEKMKTYCEGDVSKKCFKRLHRWRYSPTAAYGNNEVHLHPYKPRRLSVSEALAIQSLPKEFVMPETLSLSSKFKTIGNGVPFLLAKGVSASLKSYLQLL